MRELAKKKPAKVAVNVVIARDLETLTDLTEDASLERQNCQEEN